MISSPPSGGDSVENDDDHYFYAESKTDVLWYDLFLIPTEILDTLHSDIFSN